MRALRTLFGPRDLIGDGALRTNAQQPPMAICRAEPLAWQDTLWDERTRPTLPRAIARVWTLINRRGGFVVPPLTIYLVTVRHVNLSEAGGIASAFGDQPVRRDRATLADPMHAIDRAANHL